MDETVEELKSKGVTFERYDDLPGLTRKGEVHEAGTLKVAWFKDPGGTSSPFRTSQRVRVSVE